MKLIIAYIQANKMHEVKQMLYSKNINRFSVVDAFGHSDEDSIMEKYRGLEMEVDLKKKVRFEIAVNNDFIEHVIQAFLEGGKNGKMGDGKIFVLPIEQCFSIGSGKSGHEAIN